ncbi:MAG: SGNH/GDSL hydrolase family protein, partial [Tepidisphaeraceae bacterium]
GEYSYRYFLHHKLLDNGYNVDFVGSMTNLYSGDYGDYDFDQDHEGHTGWRAEEVLANVTQWVTSADPDVVLLHIGTNDIYQGQSVGSTLTDVEGIIDAIRGVSPSIKIIVAKILPLVDHSAEVQSFNSGLETLAASKSVGLADMYTGFSLSGDLYDGIHPDTSGEQKMADRWYAELAPMLV